MCKGMLGTLPLSDIQGPLNELHQRLAGEHGVEWLRDFKKFLRKEDRPPYMVSALRNLDSFAETYRVAQALLRYNLGYREAASTSTFEEYLESIPFIPQELWVCDNAFPYLVLVDKRTRLHKSLELAGLRFSNERSFCTLNPRSITDNVYWIRVSLSEGCSGWKPTEKFGAHETVLNLEEGIALYTQVPTALHIYTTIVLAGSACNDNPGCLSCLSMERGYGPSLCFCQDRPDHSYTLAARKVYQKAD